MFNKVQLIGRVGRTPEVRYTAGATPVTNFSMATDEVFKNQAGNREQRVTWHEIVCWANLAETTGKYVEKGKLVMVEGKLQTRSWVDKQSGQKRYKTEVRAHLCLILSAKPGNGNGEAPQAEDADDDIPF